LLRRLADGYNFDLTVVERYPVTKRGEQAGRKATAVYKVVRTPRRLCEDGVVSANVEQPDVQHPIRAARRHCARENNRTNSRQHR
jgi:hypothetical protein